MLPPDLAGQVRELSEYEFTSTEAREKFEQLMEQLREELVKSYFNQMSGAMQNISPEDMQRMKDMFAELNQLLEMRERGEDTQPAFEQFMDRYGDFFPENPQTLDELLEIMAQRMAAMQAMLNSMTPEQRAQLQGLSEQLLEDMDLRWQVEQLSNNLQSLFPQMGWDRKYNFQGQDPLGFAEAANLMQDLGDMDQLENLLRGATSPGALAEVDTDRARELLGDDAAHSLERMSELAKMLEEAGLIENREGRLRAHPTWHPQDRLQCPQRSVQEAQSRPDGLTRARAHGRGARAGVRDQAVRVRRSVQPAHRAHGAQRHPAFRPRHARAPQTR